ncbi:hypothetical protein [Haloferax gibbonsii]|uniref:hypothetical protein n=1 Tax=Haloferax gibbonsii TaxID=35746 RepID=UPI000AC3998F|nr:hypothetical protein [Haloferax gibbonsii]
MIDSSQDERIVVDRSEHDVVQDFIQVNKLDEQRVDKYKGYKQYQDWADRWFLPATIGLMILFTVVLVAITRFGGSGSEPWVDISAFAAVLVMGGIFLLSIGSSAARILSDISREKVAYHELASAFERYRQDEDNLEPIFSRIENATEYFDKRSLERLDTKRYQGTARYLQKITQADKPEYISEEFHETFPSFMQGFSKAVANPSETQFSALAKQMDSAYTGETPMKTRLVSDLKRLVIRLFTGSELVLSVAAIGLTLGVVGGAIQLSIAVGIGGIVFAVYTHYKNRD